MHQVLVNNGSSTNILYYPAFQQMRVNREQLVSVNAPLVGFKGMRVFPIGVVTLTVTVGDYPQQITKEVTFLVVDCTSTYNVIFRWPTLNLWKAVTSTYHLMIKFSTDYGVGELRGHLGGSTRMLHCYARNGRLTTNNMHRGTTDSSRAS